MSSQDMLFRSEGDTGPDLFTELEGVTISTLSGITVEVRRPDASLLTKAITVDDDTAGEFHIVWDAGDLTVGDHQLEYVVIDASGFVDRIPDRATIVIRVRAKA